METLISEYHKLRRKLRNTRVHYTDVLETILPYGLHGSGSKEVDKNLFGVLDTALHEYYESDVVQSGSVAQRVFERPMDESGVTGRTRIVGTSYDRFVPGIRVPLPNNERPAVLISSWGSSDFRSDLNNALLIFDHVGVVDPLPFALGWNRRTKTEDISHSLDYVFDQFGSKLGEVINDWISFVREYSVLIDAGIISVVCSTHRSWHVRFSGGSDSDKERWESVALHYLNFMYELWYPGRSPIEVRADHFSKGIEPKEWMWQVAHQLFLSEAYFDNSALMLSAEEHARSIHAHCVANFKKIKKQYIPSATIEATIAKTGFLLHAGHLSASDITLARDAEEDLVELREVISDIGRQFQVRTPEQWKSASKENKSRIKELSKRIERKIPESNWWSSVATSEKGGIVGAVGGSFGAVVGGGEAALLAACVGGSIPVAFDILRNGLDRTRRRKLRLSSSLLVVALSEGKG